MTLSCAKIQHHKEILKNKLSQALIYLSSLAAACVNAFNLDSNLDSNLTWISTCKQNRAMEEPAERPMDTHAIGLKGSGIRASLPGDVGKLSKKERMFIYLKLTGKPGIYKLFWNESGRHWTAMFTRNSLNFVNNLCLIAFVLLRRTKIQKKKLHAFASFFYQSK